MDRLKKFVESFRLRWQGFINRNWLTVPDGDYFRSLDSLWILGAIRFEPTTRTQRTFWTAYRLSLMCSYGFEALCALQYLFWQYELHRVIWYSAGFLTMTTSLVKHWILLHNYQAIQRSRSFINSKPCDSGDKQRDSTSRKKLFQQVQGTMLAFHALLITGQVVVSLPNSGIDQFFETPEIVARLLGPKLAGGIHFGLLATVILEWSAQYFAGPSMICFLLTGYANELEMFIGGFENVWDHVQLDIEENLPPQVEVSTSDLNAVELREALREKLFWKHLNKRIIDHIKQHVELLENMQLLESAVRMLFFVLYYNALVVIGTVVFVIIVDGPTGGSIVVGSCAVGILIECFFWCRSVEVLNDLNDTLHLNVMDLMTKIPYTKDHHKEYFEMRMTLNIMMVSIRNSCQFSCGGVFGISMEVVVQLLNVAYSVLTFLLNFR